MRFPFILYHVEKIQRRNVTAAATQFCGVFLSLLTSSKSTFVIRLDRAMKNCKIKPKASTLLCYLLSILCWIDEMRWEMCKMHSLRWWWYMKCRIEFNIFALKLARPPQYIYSPFIIVRERWNDAHNFQVRKKSTFTVA